MLPRTLLIFLALVTGATFSLKAQSIPCASRIPSGWTGAVREAAETDCAFSDESQSTGSAAWYKYAAENFGTKNATDREALRKSIQENYAKPGFRLWWWPTEAHAYGSLVVTSGLAEWHIPEAGGKETVRTTKYLTIWKRQKDSTWRFIWDGGAN